jgi:hypothetical protein
LLLRTSLIVALLVWSEWPRRYPLAWALSSLPVIDCLLWHLPLRWPAVSQSVVYSRLVQWSHDLYRLSVLILLCEAVWPGKGSPWACLAGGCVRRADDAWAQGGVKEDGTWWLEMEGHVTLTYKPRDDFEKRVLLVLFRQFRAPQHSQAPLPAPGMAGRVVRYLSGVDQPLARVRR